MPYSRAWSLNAGARAAVGEVLVLHDNDLLIPEHYASEILARVAEGYEVVDLKRFIFYLNETDTEGWLSGDISLGDGSPERVLQNAKGGSLAITRQAYWELGGFDEGFVGWGGEDDEFWERAQTRSVWPYGYMPLIHLWHDAPEGKVQHGELNMERLNARTAIPVRERIQRLSDRDAARREQTYPSGALSDTARQGFRVP
jgi:GT2 family glycosyltransferase